jgi:tetratricopeptide (TPR) repeat protein
MPEAVPTSSFADRNLLFGVLALQADLLDTGRFAEACSAWAARKETPLASLLVERGWLTPDDRDSVEQFLERKLKKHAGDVRASLAEVMSDPVKQTLDDLGDPDVRQSQSAATPPDKVREESTVDQPLGPDVGPTRGSVSSPKPVRDRDTVDYQSVGRQRYTLTRLHARGGIGQVWLAHDDDLGRDVALKELLTTRSQHPVAVARFLEEARITGQLEHPNIVPVYELARAGASGRAPFYTMRFVRGRTLAAAVRDFHDKRQANEAGPLELRGLLGHFLAVCNAVAYAHSRGVLHRDLKPHNVVLGDYGEVIVLDWGLAKLKGAAESVTSLLPVSLGKESAREATVQGQALGTPSYMPPEQAEGRLDRVDERSDVYGLGAILYEILVGKPPFRGENAQAVLAQVISEPPQPPGRQAAQTPGALEAICLKALAKKPAERYATVKQFAGDIERWLGDEPVSAHREGWSAQLARWSRRHRAWVRGTAAALAVGLVAAVTLAVQQSRAADRERQIADRERTANQLAQDRLVQVERGSDLLLSIFNDLDPRAEEKEGKPLRAILGDRIDRVAGQLHGESVSDPLTVAKLQDSLGMAQLNLGQFGRAIELYSTALRTREKTLGRDHADTLRVRSNLAEAYRFEGRMGEAIALEEETLRLRAASLGPDHPDTLQSRNNLSEAYRAAGRTARAIALHEETLKLRIAKLGPDDRETLASRSNLANAYTAAGRLADSIAMHQETLKLSAAKLGPDYIDTLVSRINVAAAYRLAGRTAEAIALNEETLKLSTAKLGPDHHITLVTRINLATAYRDGGRTAEAVALNQETFKLCAAKLGPEHPETLSSRHNLAEAYRLAGRTAEALTLHEETLKLRVAKLGPDHPDTLQSRNSLAESYESRGRWADAEPLRREVVARRRKTVPAGNPLLTRDLFGLGRNLLHLKKWAEAEALLHECSAIQVKAQPDDWSRFHTMSLLGEALGGQGRYGEAEPPIVAGYEGLKARAAKIPRTAPPFLSEAAARLVRLYEAWGKPDQAAAWKAKLR